MATKDERLHLLQVLSVFIWGLLLSVGLGGSGLLEQIASQLTAEAQQLLNLAAYIVVAILAVVSILIFLYPIFKGVHAYRLAGPLGLIGLIIGFVAGYYFLLRIQTSVILAVLAVVLWVVGRTFVRQRQARK
ncbi:MAG: hypothetical protein LUO79_01210 [Methanomassiliicoccales archaeon]|nr:hypothetical protein [Methanomassiliicoccales archaeon]